MKVIIEPGSSGNILATIAIGDSYYNSWKHYALPSWEKYCRRYDLGLVVFDENLISPDHPSWKKPTWQKMLIGSHLSEFLPNVNNICYLDTDILINFTAPNIFKYYYPETIGLVSQCVNMPYEEFEVKRKVAFFRHNYYSESYPLDSALFMPLKQIFDYHNLPVQNNYACAGLIIFNMKNHAILMNNWFGKYDQSIHSITDGGDECHFNYEVQNWGNITWLDYKFQALWIYEMASKYNFLYHYGKNNSELIKECILSSIFSNYFIHFAGSWYESDMWKLGDIYDSDKSINDLEKYAEYIKRPVYGQPEGVVKPNLLEKMKIK